MDTQMQIDTASIYVGVDLTSIDTIDLDTINDKLFGITKGGLDFTAKAKIREIEFDGKLDKSIKEMERVTGWDIKAETEALEITDKIFTMSLLNKGTSTTKFDVYTGLEGLIKSSNYSNIVIVGTLTKTAEPIILELKNVFNTEGFNFKGKDKDEASYKMSFVPRYDISKLNETPFKIYNPKIV